MSPACLAASNMVRETTLVTPTTDNRATAVQPLPRRTNRPRSRANRAPLRTEAARPRTHLMASTRRHTLSTPHPTAPPAASSHHTTRATRLPHRATLNSPTASHPTPLRPEAPRNTATARHLPCRPRTGSSTVNRSTPSPSTPAAAATRRILRNRSMLPADTSRTNRDMEAVGNTTKRIMIP